MLETDVRSVSWEGRGSVWVCRHRSRADSVRTVSPFEMHLQGTPLAGTGYCLFRKLKANTLAFLSNSIRVPNIRILYKTHCKLFPGILNWQVRIRAIDCLSLIDFVSSSELITVFEIPTGQQQQYKLQTSLKHIWIGLQKNSWTRVADPVSEIQLLVAVSVILRWFLRF